MKFKLIIIILIISSQSLNLFGQSKSKWKKSKSGEGITVYTRDNDRSKVKEVLAIKEISTTISALIAVLKDFPNQKNWIYSHKESYMLKEISDYEWISYQQTELPWPISNRDIVAKVKIQQFDDYSVKIHSVGTPKYIPENEDVIRVPLTDSWWSYKPIGKNKVLVKFQFLSNFGGSLPSWIVNIAIDSGPYNALKNLSEEVKKSKYKGIKLPYIKEKAFD